MTFKQDDEETPVIFRSWKKKEPDPDAQVTAVFPCEPAHYRGDSMSCYAILGQHGACSMNWYRTTRPATLEEYTAVKAELEAAPYGYRLKVYQRIQPWMRESLFATQRKRSASSTPG